MDYITTAWSREKGKDLANTKRCGKANRSSKEK